MSRTKLTLFYGYDPDRPHKMEVIVATPTTSSMAYALASSGTNPAGASEGAIVARMTAALLEVLTSAAKVFRARATVYSDTDPDNAISNTEITGFPSNSAGTGGLPNAGPAGRYFGLTCRNFYGKMVILHMKLLGADNAGTAPRFLSNVSLPASEQLRLQLSAAPTFSVTRLAGASREFVVCGPWSSTMIHSVIHP